MREGLALDRRCDSPFVPRVGAKALCRLFVKRRARLLPVLNVIPGPLVALLEKRFAASVFNEVLGT